MVKSSIGAMIGFLLGIVTSLLLGLGFESFFPPVDLNILYWVLVIIGAVICSAMCAKKAKVWLDIGRISNDGASGDSNIPYKLDIFQDLRLAFAYHVKFFGLESVMIVYLFGDFWIFMLIMAVDVGGYMIYDMVIKDRFENQILEYVLTYGVGYIFGINSLVRITGALIVIPLFLFLSAIVTFITIDFLAFQSKKSG